MIIPLESETYGCSYCKNKNFYFKQVVAAAKYDGTIKNIILGLKFANKHFNSLFLSRLLSLKLKQNGLFKKIDIVVPVPLSKKHLKKRGYNQAQVIAHHVCKTLGLKVSSDVLVKIKDILPQAVLSDEERFKNVQNAYKVVSNSFIKHKTVLLVDDVVTTGSTVSECSRVLLEAGAKSVYVATVAR